MVTDKINNNENESCPECGGNLIHNSFEKICTKCGLVIDIFFKESSFVSTENNKNNERTLSKQYIALGERIDFIGGLGSYIDYENSMFLKDKAGRLLRPNEQKLFRRLKKNYDQLLRLKNHETEYRIFNILNKISSYLNLNKNIRDNAAYYYRKIIKNEVKVVNNISLIGFCIFYAARKEYHNAPITIKEISEAFQNYGHRVNPRLILRDGIEYKHHIKDENFPHKSEDYLMRLINQVINHKDLEERLKKKYVLWSKREFQNKLTIQSREILKKLPMKQRGGRNPFILTGGIIYLADKLLAKKFFQKPVLAQWIISEATNIAEYSIRDHYVNVLKPIFRQSIR